MAPASTPATRPALGTSTARPRHLEALLAALAALAVRALGDQLVARCAAMVIDAVSSMAPLLPHSASGSGGPVHGVLGSATATAGLVDGWTHGAAGVAVLLVLPAGGPAWAGVVPMRLTLRVVAAAARACTRWAGHRSRSRAPRNPVSRNVSPAVPVDHGFVLPTLLIVDDNARFREQAARALARDGFDVVDTASGTADAMASIARLCPQVVLVDVHLGPDSGFDLVRQVAQAAAVATDRARRAVRTVLMSTHDEDDLADLIAASPAAGFVAKDRLSGRAVREVLGGDG